MKQTSVREILLPLLSVHGATGREQAVADHLKALLQSHVDSFSSDSMGNLIAVKKGKPNGKRILFSAHMDHIGFVVIDAEKDGFVRVCAVGGIYVRVSLGQHVVFANGVRGVVSADEKESSPEMQHLYIDIGAKTREEALNRVAIGEVAVYAPQVAELENNRLSAPAMDDRAGCALAAWLLMHASNTEHEIICVFSSQEEVGLRGARVAAYSVDPDIGIALDVTATGDTPNVKNKMAVALGNGPAIKVMDRSVICSPVIRDALVAAAQENSIPYQMEVLTAGGTDAGAIQVSRAGVPTGAVSIPTRYIHSAAETIDLTDLDNAAKLLLAFVNRTF